MVELISTGTLTGSGQSAGYLGRSVAPQAATPPTLSQDQMDALSLRTFNTVNTEMNTGRTRTEMITRSIWGTGVNLVDNVWASPLNPVGWATDIKSGDIWSLADDSDRQFYTENKELIDATSGVVGTVLSLTLGDKLVTKAAGAALASSTAISGSRLYQAARGGWETGHKAAILARQTENALQGAKYTLLNNKEGWKYLGYKSGVETAKAVRQEAVVFGVMWENDMINQEGWGDDAFWIGVGAGFGAVAGAVQARSVARKLANGLEVRSTLASNYSMAGVSDMLVRDSADPVAYQAIRYEAKVMEDSTELTQYLIASRANNPQGVETSARVQTQMDQLRAGFKQTAIDKLTGWFGKGVDAMQVPKAPAADKIPEVVHLIEEVVPKDPYLFHGASQIAIATRDTPEQWSKRMTVLREESEKLTQEMKTSKNPGALRERQMINAARQKEEAFLLLNGEHVAVDSKLGKAALDFDQKRAKGLLISDENGTAVKTQLPDGTEVIIDGSLAIRRLRQSPSEAARPGGRKIRYQDLDATSRLYVQEAMIDIVKKHTRPDVSSVFRITANNADDWATLDMAAEIESRGGKIQYSDTKGRVNNLEDLKRVSLQSKARQVLAEVPESAPLTEEIRLKYNLPMPTSMERHSDPNGTVFRQWLKAAASDKGTMQELSLALNKARASDGLDLMAASVDEAVDLTGGLFKWNRDKNGNFMRPLFVTYKPKSQMYELSRRGVEEAAQAQIAERMMILTDRTKNTFVHNTARMLLEMPETNMARGVSGLSESQSTGIGGAISQIAGEFLPKRFLHRDNTVILAASRLLETATRAADMDFRKLLKGLRLDKVITAMDTPGKASLSAQLDEFMSLRPGWDIAEPMEVEPGWWAFQLDNTENNRKLLGVDKIETGDFMPNLRIDKPIMLSTEAMQALLSFGQLTDDLLAGTNVIRKAKGRLPVGKKNFFVPTQDTQGKLVGYVFDENGQPVKMNTIIASTQAEFDQLSARTLAELPTGYKITERSILEQTRDVWDLEAMEWIDHGRSSATAGIGRQSGGLTGAFVRKGAFMEALEWARNQKITQARETLEAVMAEPIRLAKLRAAADKMREVGGKPKERSIFDEYIQALTGRSAAYRDSQMLAGAVRKIEQVIDKAFAAQSVQMPARHIMDIAHRFGIDPRTLSSKRTYDEIVREMGDKSPFRDITDYLESQGARVPPTIRGVTQSLNSLATNVVLRWDPTAAHATMNMLGLIPTLFGGVAAGGAPATINLAVKGRKVPMLDTMKILRESIRDLGRGDMRSKRDLAWMVAHGDAAQSSLEYAETMNAMTSHAGFMGVAKRIDKAASWFSDKSENFSRTVAHTVGLRVADYQGIKGMPARHAFAREFANAAIADYTPTNRPELYQTALGSVFGLFQSYVVNQYTKMFHWLEDGNYRAMGIQAAFQASLFGAQGTYGIGSLFNLNHAMLGETGEPSIVDMAYKRFGPTMGGALMHGGFGELTQIALWTRGDINLRVPGSGGQMPPGLDVMARVTKMMYGTVEETLKQGPIDAMPAIIENIQREMPNRVLKGLMAVTLLDGKETDKYGQIMTDTRNWVDTIIRIGGVRSRRMQQELEVFYANKSDLDKDAARRDSLRSRVRTDLRAAERNGTSIDMMAYFDDYVGSGGNPRMFKSFVKDALEDAVTPRSAQQLKKSLDTRRNSLHLWRYGGYGAWGIDDGTSPAQ